jgi:hypothetical protein
MVLSSASLGYERFSTVVVRLDRSFVQGGSIGIKINDDIGHYFQTLKGL